MSLLRVQGLFKAFAAIRAVDSVSFEVRPGEIYGLLGPNGAGKTTTITMISGLPLASPTNRTTDKKLRTMIRNVGIYIFDEIEVLDLGGPFEVFSTASRMKARLNPGSAKPFEVFTIGETIRPVRARGGLMVQPAFDITNHPAIDVLIVPGGVVTGELARPAIIEWIAQTAGKASLTASVCTGAFILAKAGLLSGKTITTHWEDIADFRAMFPDIPVRDNARWVDAGAIVTSAGIAAGLDMSLHLVSRLESEELAVRTARQMDYDWQR